MSTCREYRLLLVADPPDLGCEGRGELEGAMNDMLSKAPKESCWVVSLDQGTRGSLSRRCAYPITLLHLTLRRYSQTFSSSQFLTESGPSPSEKSDSVGLANIWLALGLTGARRGGGAAIGEPPGAEVEALKLGKNAVLGASMAILKQLQRRLRA
jgi:hypothetical protein